MAHILAKRGNDPRCEIVLRELIRVHPDFGPAYNELAELYMRADDVQGALAILQEGMAVLPDDVVLINNIGMCHLRLEDKVAAAEAFERACVVDPKDARARGNLALAIGLQGNIHAAEELFIQASKRSIAWQNMVYICDTLGEPESARHYRGLLNGYRIPQHEQRHEARLKAAGLN
jgi:Flp pilus assembly protein TadD